MDNNERKNERKNATDSSIGKVLTSYSAMAGLICGGISVVLWLVYWLGSSAADVTDEGAAIKIINNLLAALVFGIIGIIFANKARKRGEKTTVAKAGFIVSIIAVIFNVYMVLSLGCTACMAACMAPYAEEVMSQYDEEMMNLMGQMRFFIK